MAAAQRAARRIQHRVHCYLEAGAIETGQAGLHHLMVELFNLDDVGQGYDLAIMEEGRVATCLGRHTNDFMTSFYARTPGGFLVEYGWGRRRVAPATWQPVEMHSDPQPLGP